MKEEKKNMHLVNRDCGGETIEWRSKNMIKRKNTGYN